MEWKTPEDIKKFVKDIWVIDIDNEEAQRVFEMKDKDRNGFTLRRSYLWQYELWGERMRKNKRDVV